MKFTIKSLNPFKRKAKLPKPKANLVFAFKYGGYNYYQWPDPLTLPMERLGKSILFSGELAQGIDTATYERLLSMAESHIMKGATNHSDLVKAIGVLHEIKLRKTQIAPISIYYNQFAVNYIREDEDPERYNQQIQIEKVNAFAEAALDRDSFFFALPEYKELCKRLNIFSENWTDVIALSHQAQQRNDLSESLLR